MTKTNSSPDTVLDRQCERRIEPGFLETVMVAENTRVVFFHRGKALLAAPATATGTEPPALAYFSQAQLPIELPAGTHTVYLGTVLPGQGHALPTGTQIVLHALPFDAFSPDGTTAGPTDMDDAGKLAWVPTGSLFSGYRDVGEQLSAADAQIFIQAQAVATWHATHTFCPRCGSPTETESAGWMRRCVNDASEHFPRTDPAVIVAIVGDDERILLANNFAWDENRYSTVAGFVESGESAEAGAVREITEEVGVHLHALEYHSSQAWPFPRSLMLGFLGYTHDTEATPDLTEVRAARWFSRTELQEAVLSGEAVISPRLSIARELIEHWYGGNIVEPGDQA